MLKFAAGKNAQELETLYQTQIRALISDPTPAKAKKVAADLVDAAPDGRALE